MKKYKKIFLLLLISIMLTGCTKYVQTDDKKIVTNPDNGQKIVENALCRPTDKKTIEIYKENKVSISKLSECKDFSVSDGGYEGVWNTLFVKTLAWIIIKIGTIVKNYGLSIAIVTLLIRGVLFPLTQKTAMQSEYMKEAQKDIEKIEKKYENKTSKEDTFAKSQELSMVYKKHNVNPLSSCLFAFIQIPLFFAFYEALNRLPVVFEGNFLGLQLGMSPIVGMQNGNYFYIIVILLVILTTALSFKLNGNVTTESNQGQMKMMTYFSIGLIAITSFSVSTAIAVYWIANSTFTIIQNYLVKRSKK